MFPQFLETRHRQWMSITYNGSNKKATVRKNFEGV